MGTFQPWIVRHVNLHEAIPDLPPAPNLGGYFVVFWAGGRPLGHREIPAAHLPMPEGHLAALAARAVAPAVGKYLLARGFDAPLPVASRYRVAPEPADLAALLSLHHPLERLRERLQPDTRKTTQASVSVVVCTRDRPEQLARCLDALLQLTRRPQEIVVVDNAARTDATRTLVDRTPGIRYVSEPRPGLSVARNTGIRHSTGDLIAFTDDDVVVHPDWIDGLLEGFRHEDVLAVTGLILPAELRTEAQFIFQRGQGRYGWGYRALTFGPRFFEQMKGRGVPVWHIGAGANMAFRRSVFEQVGLFDERLGAGASGCSEDSELWYRILAEGGRCRYEPAAVVSHYHRPDPEGFRHQMYQYMRGHVAALLIQFEKYGHWGNLYRAFGVLPGYYAQLLGRRLRPGGRAALQTLGAQLRGCAAGVAYYARHARRAGTRPIEQVEPDPDRALPIACDHG